MELSEYERRFLVDALKDALCEVEQVENVSQGVEDKLISSLELLGESYE